MDPLTFKNYVAALRQVGVKAGDTLLVHSALAPIGQIEAGKDREKVLNFYLSGLQEALTPAGTLVVYTPFEDYGRFGTPFILEESPSRAGVLSEYVRTRPGAVRSLHPINSLTALGARAEEFCGSPHYEGFGYDSPWGRIHRAGGKMLSLGLPFMGCLTFTHYIETCYGVPYKYTKVYTTPVYAKGKLVSGLFTMGVRYLDFSIAFSAVRFQALLIERGVLREVVLGRALMHCADLQPMLTLGMEALNQDRYFLLEAAPKFRPGEIPLDGNTGPLKEVYHKDPRTEKA